MEEERENTVVKEEEGKPFFPNHLLDEVIVVFIIFGILIGLTTFFPAPMEPKADPFVTPHIKPEWYFLASYQFLKLAEVLNFLGPWAPKLLGLMAQGAVILLLFLLPFIDKNKERHPKKRPIAVSLGIAFVLGYIVLTIWGYLS